MPMTQSTSYSTISIGITELVLGGIAVICGIVSMSKLTNPAATTIGIWALYFAIPGVLCILAGFKHDATLLAISLGMNVIGIILAGVAVLIGGLFWTILNFSCYNTFGLNSDFCTCGRLNDNVVAYAASCSDLKVVRNATAAATIMYILLLITSFVGSIMGCVGTCCAPRESHVVVTQAVAAPGTVIVSSNQQSSFGYAGQPSYPPGPGAQQLNQMPPPSYEPQYPTKQ